MASSLELTFSDKAVADNTFDFLGNGASSTLTFKGVRLNKNQVGIGTDAITQAEQFYKAFYNDFNMTGLYEDMSLVGAIVTLVHNDNDHFDNFVDGTHNNTPAITTSLSTTTQRPANLEITVVFDEPASDPCNNVEAAITFNQTVDELVLKVDSPSTGETTIYTNDSFDNTTHTLDITRNKFFLQIETTINGEEEFTRIAIPQPLEMRETTITQTGAGSQAEINTNTFVGVTENQFALGNNGNISPYQNSRVFNGLLEGNYLGYAKDKYGCVKSIPFTVSQSSTTPMYTVPQRFFFSMKNSLRGAYRDVIGSANPFNFLTPETPVPNPYTNFYHVFGDHQTVTQQFSSGFQKHRVQVMRCPLNGEPYRPINMTVMQITDNVQRNTYLEGNVSYSAILGKTLVSFTPGDRYKANGDVSGSHSYNQVLPEFYVLGMVIIINDVFYSIIDIKDIEGIEYAVLNLNNDITIEGAVIESIHKAVDYERFEYDLDMSVLPEEFYVEHKFIKTNDTFGAGYTTEKVKIIPEQELIEGKYHVIELWNESDDNEITYRAKIDGQPVRRQFKTLMNLEYVLTPTPITDSEINTEKLDNKVKKIDYSSKVVYRLNLAAMPTEVAHAVAYTFNNTQYQNIDGMLCTTAETAEVKTEGYQMATVEVKVILSELVNSLNSQSTDIPLINPFYPVVQS